MPCRSVAADLLEASAPLRFHASTLPAQDCKVNRRRLNELNRALCRAEGLATSGSFPSRSGTEVPVGLLGVRLEVAPLAAVGAEYPPIVERILPESYLVEAGVHVAP
jgi:hypothetical protein